MGMLSIFLKKISRWRFKVAKWEYLRFENFKFSTWACKGKKSNFPVMTNGKFLPWDSTNFDTWPASKTKYVLQDGVLDIFHNLLIFGIFYIKA